jgi:SAM-dependent methyltransferase
MAAGSSELQRHLCPGNEWFIASLLDAARVGSGSRVLDLACEPGLVAPVARQRGAVAIGLDFSAAMIALARAEIPVSASRKATRKRCRLPTVRSTPSCRISESITCRMLFGHYRRLVGFYARVVGLGSPAGQYPPRTSPGRFSSMRSPRMATSRQRRLLPRAAACVPRRIFCGR